jgi:fluoroacetyl-CoA thioesterase
VRHDVAVRTGLTGKAALVVSHSDTAMALGSGDVPVLGTPRVVALAEAATIEAVGADLPTGSTTVGARVDIEHLRPSAVGAEVEARATLTVVDGRRLVFAVSVVQDGDEVARGTVTRVVVDRAAFAASR